MNLKVRLLSLSTTFDFDRTLELIFVVTLSLIVKMLYFRKEGKFKEKEDDDADKVNKVILAIVVE